MANPDIMLPVPHSCNFCRNLLVDGTGGPRLLPVNCKLSQLRSPPADNCALAQFVLQELSRGLGKQFAKSAEDLEQFIDPKLCFRVYWDDGDPRAIQEVHSLCLVDDEKGEVYSSRYKSDTDYLVLYAESGILNPSVNIDCRSELTPSLRQCIESIHFVPAHQRKP
jgi:hypothetical protein